MPYRCALVGLVFCVCSAGAPALAQTGADDGVSVDPNSPAGAEYKLPLSAAREDAAGTPGRNGSDRARDAPLFGAGAEPARPAAEKSDAPTGSSERGGNIASDDVVTESSRRSLPGSAGATQATRTVADGGLHSGMSVALGALLVLAVGGVVGLVLRRPFNRQ